jgi:hypothetical protein
MRLILILFSLLFSAFALNAQTPKKEFHLIKDDCLGMYDNLKSSYGENLNCPEDYELSALIALSAYPELWDKNIEFVYSKGAYTMAARPAPLSLFKSRKNRVYRVFINTESRNKGLLLHQVPFNAQVGIIVHELAHILYYTKRSSLGIIWDGISYSSKKFREKFEKDTDKEAIQRGYGWQVHNFSKCTMEMENVPEKYKKYKSKIYLTPDAILSIILKDEEQIVLEQDEKTEQ